MPWRLFVLLLEDIDAARAGQRVTLARGVSLGIGHAMSDEGALYIENEAIKSVGG